MTRARSIAQEMRSLLSRCDALTANVYRIPKLEACEHSKFRTVPSEQRTRKTLAQRRTKRTVTAQPIAAAASAAHEHDQRTLLHVVARSLAGSIQPFRGCHSAVGQPGLRMRDPLFQRAPDSGEPFAGEMRSVLEQLFDVGDEALVVSRKPEDRPAAVEAST